MNARQHVHDRLDSALEAALAAQVALEDALALLCDRRGLCSLAETARQRATEARDRCALDLGLAVLACLRAGEPVDLYVEAPEADVALPPEEVAPGLAVELESAAAVEPEVAPSVPPEPAVVPPPAAKVDALARHFAEGQPIVPDLGSEACRADAEAYVSELQGLNAAGSGAIPRLARLRTLVLDLRRLDLLLDARRKTVVHALVCEARSIQDETTPPLPLNEQGPLRELFGRLGAYRKDSGIPFLNGLARTDKPRGAGWAFDRADALASLASEAAELGRQPLLRLQERLSADSLRAGDIPLHFAESIRAGMPGDDPELLALAHIHRAVLCDSPLNKTLRKKLKRMGAAPPPALVEAPPEPVEVNPLAVAYLQGCDGVVVGGDPRGQSQQRIHEAFGFSTLAWERGKKIRQVQALAKRVESGNVNCLVFLRRYISHKLSDVLQAAAERAGAKILWVDQGYGVTQVEQAALRAAGQQVPGVAC